MVLEVIDDGTGFDPATVSGANGGAMGGSEPTGFGLAAMRERAELLGGKLELASSPKRGTTVRLTVPLSRPWLGRSA
jgi:signal transduction histidine kinase